MSFKNLLKTGKLLIGLMLFGSPAFGQVPSNDTCANALEIQLGSGGFGLGTFQGDSINIDSATVQVAEFFHSSLTASGNDKRSIWFKFYIPARRGINIELKQNANAIAIKDCGFTTYLGDQCLPTSTMATAAKLTTLNQFGSSFHPCMEPGWYMIQVSSKSRAAGKVFIEITTSFPYETPAVVNAEYDAQDSAYDFGNQVVGMPGSQDVQVEYELGCYTIDDSSELYKGLGTNYKEYNQSAWFVFKSNTDHDHTQLRFSHKANCATTDTMAYRLYKGDARGSGGLQLLDSNYYDWRSANTCYWNCSEVVVDYECLFDSGEVYSVQLLYHKDLDKTMRFRITDQTSQYAGYPKPETSLTRDLGSLPDGTNQYLYGFSCESKFSNSSCGNSNNQPVSMGSWNYNMNEWMTFELASYSNLSVYVYNGSNNNYKNYQRLAFRLYQDTVTASCSDIDTSNIILSGYGTTTYEARCLPPGKYVIQLLGVDSIWNYSNQRCNPNLHLGGDYRLRLIRTAMPDYNRFALKNVGEADSINRLNDLPNFTRITGGLDTVACYDGVLPVSSCDTNRDYRKVMYRTLTIGDADGDGNADSGMLYISNMQVAYRGWPYYDYNSWHQLYKGDALALRASQSVSSFPDTLKGLVPVNECIPQNQANQNFCLEPGTYTLVSRFDNDAVSRTEQPNFTFTTARTKFDAYSKAEFVDSIMGYGNHYGDYDTFTCKTNPDTIDGVNCGIRNTYHVFYLDSSAVVTVGVNYYYAYYYLGDKISLFSGDIRNGKSGLKLYKDGLNWGRVNRGQRTSDCKPLKAGWYTVVVGNDWDIGYDSTMRMRNGYQHRLYYYPHRIEINARAPNVVAPKYYRPSKAAYLDSLINNNKPLSYDTNYSTLAGNHLNLKRYSLPTEILECELDTPMNHFPKSQLCDTATTDLVYYTFNLAKDAYVKVWSAVSGGSWDVKLFNFDVRKDSARLATAKAIQECNYNANYIDLCNLQAGAYSLVYMCKRAAGTRATVTPTMYIDSVSISRFDHANHAYDFGKIPGDGKFYDGKIGDVHPLDTNLPASHDIITCKTGAQITDPFESSCYNTVMPLIYSGDTNVVLYPYDSSYQTYSSGTTYNPYRYNPKRNLWYSFVVEGRGNVTVELKGLNSSLLAAPQNAIRFAVYESDEDGSLSLASLRSSGKIDSTVADGLKYIVRDQTWYCYYTSDRIADFAIEACEKIKPRRYYVLVETTNYYNSTSKPNVNQNIWLQVKYDSVTIPDTKFDYYSTANKINGLNDANLLRNPGFNATTEWTSTVGSWRFNYYPTLSREGGVLWPYYQPYHRSDTASLYQEVDVTGFAKQIAAGTAKSRFSGYIRSKTETVRDQGRVVKEYLNSSGNVISSWRSSWYSSDSSWDHVTDVRTIPSGTEKIRIRVEALYRSADYYIDAYFDQFDLRVDVANRADTTKLRSYTLYQGDETYLAGATLDSTDLLHNYTTTSCTDSATGGTVWYKFDIDSSGYMHCNFKYTDLSGTPPKPTSNHYYDRDRLRIYRSVKKGDSTTGLEYVNPSFDNTRFYSSLLGGYHQFMCVQPGTYYMQINRCGWKCDRTVIPQMVFDFYPVQPTKYDYYSTANLVNDVGTPNTVFTSKTVYRGDSTYFLGATLDSTDYNRTYYYGYCSDPAYARTVWYKLNVDSTGYMYYNYDYDGNSSGYGHDESYIRVYRSTIDGDSLNGLTRVPRIARVYGYQGFGSQYSNYICVQPGTYYVQINSCNQYQCVEYVTPKFVFDFHSGDFCETAIPLRLDTLEKATGRLLVNCHTIGTDFGEDGSDMGCLYGPSGYKSSWFVVDYTDTTKVDL
ncbi:MAG: hypothetical protein JJ975_15050, partial [Bacteroidia bacterium]|nr:hypothetical protein [Bacteroidia bacterium]